MLDKQKVEDQSDAKVIQTDGGAKDGQTKCPKCGATDISLNVNNSKLRCNFCRHEFEPEQVTGLENDLSKLSGQIIASGASDIVADTKDVLTLKCSSCGSEVVIDTSEVTQARCHWCRNTLSINQQIPNGAVPDVVLPFAIKKEVAKQEIEVFVGKRKFFAHPKFRAEFTTENIMGVYFPYMVVDINAQAKLKGQGEHLIRSYTRGSGDNEETYYDADLYDVEREFDLVVEGLTVESSADKLDSQAKDKTNNVINAIMPFDTEKSVKWDANYLKGFSSEKRDTNIKQLKGLVDLQAKDIARHSANETLTHYDRGVRWDNEQLAVKGQQWKSAYLPVWLYSYQQTQGDKKILHYVAVNARTKETMGSVPIHMPKLVAVSVGVEIIGLFFWWKILIDWDYGWLCIFAGIAYFLIMYARYRNAGARHHHEKETKAQKSNLKKVDTFIKKRIGLRNPHIEGANNTSILASQPNTKYKALNSIMEKNPLFNTIKDKVTKTNDSEK